MPLRYVLGQPALGPNTGDRLIVVGKYSSFLSIFFFTLAFKINFDSLFSYINKNYYLITLYIQGLLQ